MIQKVSHLSKLYFCCGTPVLRFLPVDALVVAGVCPRALDAGLQSKHLFVVAVIDRPKDVVPHRGETAVVARYLGRGRGGRA